MSSLILRTVTRALVSLIILFSIFVLLRGHDEPGGGFIGGLLAAAAFALQAIAFGIASARQALRIHPIAIAGGGLSLAILSGLPPMIIGQPFLTGLWWLPKITEDVKLPISTVLFFDIGVYLVVLGTLTAILLALEKEEEEAEE
jgi:multicomponent Na+:H+ antiporter subunit B